MKTSNELTTIVAAADRKVGDVVPEGVATYRDARVGNGVELTGERTTLPGVVTAVEPAGPGCSFRVARVRLGVVRKS